MQNSGVNEFEIPKIDRSLEEVEGGFWDDFGCYTTPDGSFWDENGVYFNRFGYDINGGTMDKYGVYIPGPGWNEELFCYDDEIFKMPEKENQNQILDGVAEEVLENIQFFEEQISINGGFNNFNSYNTNNNQIPNNFDNGINNYPQTDNKFHNENFNTVNIENSQNGIYQPKNEIKNVATNRIFPQPNKSNLNFSNENGNFFTNDL